MISLGVHKSSAGSQSWTHHSYPASKAHYLCREIHWHKWVFMIFNSHQIHRSVRLYRKDKDVGFQVSDDLPIKNPKYLIHIFWTDIFCFGGASLPHIRWWWLCAEVEGEPESLLFPSLPLFHWTLIFPYLNFSLRSPFARHQHAFAYCLGRRKPIVVPDSHSTIGRYDVEMSNWMYRIHHPMTGAEQICIVCVTILTRLKLFLKVCLFGLIRNRRKWFIISFTDLMLWSGWSWTASVHKVRTHSHSISFNFKMSFSHTASTLIIFFLAKYHYFCFECSSFHYRRNWQTWRNEKRKPDRPSDFIQGIYLPFVIFCNLKMFSPKGKVSEQENSLYLLPSLHPNANRGIHFFIVILASHLYLNRHSDPSRSPSPIGCVQSLHHLQSCVRLFIVWRVECKENAWRNRKVRNIVLPKIIKFEIWMWLFYCFNIDIKFRDNKKIFTKLSVRVFMTDAVEDYKEWLSLKVC